MKKTLIYLAVLVLSALFLLVGNRMVRTNFYDDYADDAAYYTGVVTEIVARNRHTLGFGFDGADTEIIFDVRLTTRGQRRGEIITASQMISDFFIVNEREVSVGDRVVLFYADWDDSFSFVNYTRINHMLIFGGIFIALVILFARKKGFNALVALGFTCLAIFTVFIPAILAGRNIYLTTLVICAYAMVSTLLIVVGISKKALTAMVGCIGGALLAGVSMLGMNTVLQLTGALDRETEVLLLLPTYPPISLSAIVFAGVILGAMGAIMDVAMTISSSLWEVKAAGGGGLADFKGIVKSGINIGRDILGTQLNTLILAYIGSSMSLILLVSANAISLTNLFNMEMIIVELLRALVGSLGMLLTIPLTAVVCGWLYGRDTEEVTLSKEV